MSLHLKINNNNKKGSIPLPPPPNSSFGITSLERQCLPAKKELLENVCLQWEAVLGHSERQHCSGRGGARPQKPDTSQPQPEPQRAHTGRASGCRVGAAELAFGIEKQGLFCLGEQRLQWAMRQVCGVSQQMRGRGQTLASPKPGLWPKKAALSLGEEPCCVPHVCVGSAE